MKTKRLLISIVVSYFIFFTTCFALSEEARSKGFVYLHEVDPSIISSVRYYTNENFVGTQVTGYNKPVIIMTRQAAEALKLAQQEFLSEGYCIVVYDAYRPQKAVDHFMAWGENISDQLTKPQYYPYVDKSMLFKLDYVAKRSGHSRGSTVDITLIKTGTTLHSIQETNRTLLDGRMVKFLDDGTVDMGTSFDLFDEASHHENSLITENFKAMRAYLKNKMIKYGFRTYTNEWWHFALKNEPYPASLDSSYFDFDIE